MSHKSPWPIVVMGFFFFAMVIGRSVDNNRGVLEDYLVTLLQRGSDDTFNGD